MDTGLRSSDEPGRTTHPFAQPNITPRQKGSNGPLKSPSSPDVRFAQVWESTQTRQERIEEQTDEERGTFEEVSDQDINKTTDELRAFTRWHTVSTIDWANVMAKDLEPYMQLPEYDGLGNPKTHWFRCVSIWETRTTQDEKRQINEFGARLNGDALDWFIKVKKNIINLDDLERLFVARFQHPDRDEIAISQFRLVKQLSGEIVFDYDKKFKTLMSQLDEAPSTRHQVMYYVDGLKPKIAALICQHKLANIQEAFERATIAEHDGVWLQGGPSNDRLEQQLEEMQQ